MNWHFDSNPSEDGIYVLVRNLEFEDKWSNYGATFYTIKGGWNTYYDSAGRLKCKYSIDVENWCDFAWTTEEEFNAFINEDIKNARAAIKG